MEQCFAEATLGIEMSKFSQKAISEGKMFVRKAQMEKLD